MREASIAEVKSSLSQLLDRAAEGEDIIITRRGEPIAMLTRPPVRADKPKLGTLAGTVIFANGWDDPMTDQEFDDFTNQGKL